MSIGISAIECVCVCVCVRLHKALLRSGHALGGYLSQERGKD